MGADGVRATAVPVVSVVVPTRDRPIPLAACLEALAVQAGAPDFEVVVVDDASVDGRAVADVVSRHPRARLVQGEGRGPAAARNRGARAARGSVICFTDDDCRPAPGWVAAMAGALSGRGEVVAAGPTRNARRSNPYATASQAITNHLVAASRSGDEVTFAPTSNVACPPSLHQRVSFDETFPLAAGEDRDWCTRLGDLGVPITYVEDAWVDHHQDLTFARFWRQQVRYGRGAHRWQNDRRRGERLQPARFYLDLLRRGLAGGPKVAALVVLAQLATAFGLTAEAASALKRRSAPAGESPPGR